ncbi:hypothetical protein JCM15765_39720 [Paradesulfitobacterium aromaticivorans]
MYYIPKRIINSLAKVKKIKIRGESIDKVIEELEKEGLTNTLEYLDEQFRFAEATKALTVCKPERSFPESANTAEKFVNKLIKEKKITQGQVGTLWECRYSSKIKLCGIIQDGSDVFIKNG